VTSLLRQDYRGPLTILVVDDDSEDGTGAVATDAAAGDGRLRVVRTTGPAAGWTGKLWAVSQGIAAAEASHPEYLLLTDADIEHMPDTVSRLVARSVNGRFVLTSLMAKLRCVSLAEKCHVPAFIYFFQMLYPFAWVSRADSSTAAAAGGCMLVRADALAKVGGIASIRGALIDDCSLAAKLKTVGPIFGLTNRAQHPAVPSLCRCRADGLTLGLQPIALLVARFDRHNFGHGDHLCRATNPGSFCLGIAAISWPAGLGGDVIIVRAHFAVLSAFAHMEPGPPGNRFALHVLYFAVRVPAFPA
jgi:glycosyltransferase involved in cell wall biosynthesis